jgi:transcriptional regulator with GAF, ATPase, and Fis domain
MVAPGRENQLINAFVELADTLVSDFDVADMLHGLVGHCVDLLDLEAAGLLLSDQRGSLQVVASSTERTRLLELFQLETNSGPCLECFRTGEPVSAPDLAATPVRWPLFVQRAREEGYAAVHALPMRLRDNIIGALNLFTATAGELPEDDLQVAQALADVATIGILQEREIHQGEMIVEQLQGALNSRVVIEQAKGLIAEAGTLDMDEAFARLRRYARSNSSRLAEVAHQLVDGSLGTSDVLAERHAAPRPGA